MNYVVGHFTQKSAILDAEKHTYTKIVGKTRTWLVRQGKFAADNIYLIEDGRGMGGALITFKLDNGNEVYVRGPWLSNPGELFDDTGVDLRDKLSTFVVLSENLIYNNSKAEPTMSYVVFKDSEPVEGHYMVGKQLAKHYANKLNKKIFFYQQTAGGSLLGSEIPNKGYENES